MSMLGLVLLALAAILLPATGLPAFAVLLAMAVAGAAIGVIGGGVDPALLTALPARLINLLESDLLQALPLYVLMGGLLNRLPIADALFRSTLRLLRENPAGPAVAAIGLGTLLGPMNGSVGASVVALSHTAAPRLAASGMPAPARHALVAVASTLGLVVPPSLVLILLGDAMMAAHTIALHGNGRADRILNTQDVFRGALVPAGLFLVGVIAVSVVAATRRSTPVAAERNGSVPRDAFVALAALGFVGTLLVGVAAGYFHAVEGAAAGAFLLFVAALMAGRLKGSALRTLLGETIATTGTLFALLAAATTFTLVFRALGTDGLLDRWIATLPGGGGLTTLLVLGAIGASALALDAFEIIFMLVPVLMPPLLTRVPDATWVAVLVLLTLQASFLLPPIGYALLMTRGVLGERVSTRALWRCLLPYLVAQLVVFGCVFAFPALVHFGQSEVAPTFETPPTPVGERTTQQLPDIPVPPVGDDDPAQNK